MCKERDREKEKERDLRYAVDVMRIFNVPKAGHPAAPRDAFVPKIRHWARGLVDCRRRHSPSDRANAPTLQRYCGGSEPPGDVSHVLENSPVNVGVY